MLDENFWRKYFKVYDSLNLLIPYQELLQDLENELALNLDDIVLDVGSGTGNLLVRIRNKCKEIIGIDYSQKGIEITKLKSPGAKVILHNISKQFPFPDNYFSKVVSNNTIYTLADAEQLAAIFEIYRVLKHGGKFVISNVINNYNPLSIYFYHISKSIKKYGVIRTLFLIIRMTRASLKMFYYNMKIKKSGIERNYHFLSANEQEQLLKRAGFKNISKSRYVYGNQAILTSGFKI